MKMFKDLIQHTELEWEFIDGSIIRCHWNSLIPRFTAKYNVHMLVDDEVHETDVEADVNSDSKTGPSCGH